MPLCNASDIGVQCTSDLLTTLRANFARIDGLAAEDQTPQFLNFEHFCSGALR